MQGEYGPEEFWREARLRASEAQARPQERPSVDAKLYCLRHRCAANKCPLQCVVALKALTKGGY